MKTSETQLVKFNSVAMLALPASAHRFGFVKLALNNSMALRSISQSCLGEVESEIMCKDVPNIVAIPRCGPISVSMK